MGSCLMGLGVSVCEDEKDLDGMQHGDGCIRNTLNTTEFVYLKVVEIKFYVMHFTTI